MAKANMEGYVFQSAKQTVHVCTLVFIDLWNKERKSRWEDLALLSLQ